AGVAELRNRHRRAFLGQVELARDVIDDALVRLMRHDEADLVEAALVLRQQLAYGSRHFLAGAREYFLAVRHREQTGLRVQRNGLWSMPAMREALNSHVQHLELRAVRVGSCDVGRRAVAPQMAGPLVVVPGPGTVVLGRDDQRLARAPGG